MSNSLPYIAYGFATSIFDDHTLDNKTSHPIPTQPPIPAFTDHDGTHDHNTDDHNDNDHHNPGPFPPSLPSGCRFDTHDRNYVYTKNGKSAKGSTCEIAILNWNIKYGRNPPPRPVPIPLPVPRPRPVIIVPPHLPGLCVKDGKRYIFKGRVRCHDNRKHGCLREVIGKSCSDAKNNFCKLYGHNGKCFGDPAVTIQDPDDFRGDNDTNIVIKIIDDDSNMPDAVPVAADEAEQQQKAADAAAPPVAPPAAPTAAPAADLSGVLAGTTAGIPNVVLLAGGAMMLFMVMALRK